jgi:hypothetical protein
LKIQRLLLALAFVVLPAVCFGQQNSNSFISRYQVRVTKTQAAQPHWVTPLVTVTPRLEQEVRTDFVRQRNNQDFSTWNLGGSKGLELIPERHVELIFNVPPFFDHSQPGQKDGFGDVSFLAKYRLLSRNEEHGNGIVTAFLAATVPTGKNGNGSCCAVVTPTLAVGKGFGQFAITSTAGGSHRAYHNHSLFPEPFYFSRIKHRLYSAPTYTLDMGASHRIPLQHRRQLFPCRLFL